MVAVFLSQSEKVIFLLWNFDDSDIIKEIVDRKAKLFRIFIINGPGVKVRVVCALLDCTKTPIQVFSLSGLLLFATANRKDLEKKNILKNRIVIIPTFMEETSSSGFITIETSTELNRRSLDLAGLRQTHRFRT